MKAFTQLTIEALAFIGQCYLASDVSDVRGETLND